MNDFEDFRRLELRAYLGRIAYEEAAKQNFRYTQNWESLDSDEQEYWNNIADAVVEAEAMRILKHRKAMLKVEEYDTFEDITEKFHEK